MLGVLLGVSLQTELLIMTLLGLANSTLDWKPFELVPRLSKIRDLDLSTDRGIRFSDEATSRIKRLLSVTVVIEFICSLLNPFAYLLMLYPIITWSRSNVLLPWLVTHALNTILPKLVSVTLALVFHSTGLISTLSLAEFLIVESINLLIACYNWRVFFSFYLDLRELKREQRPRESHEKFSYDSSMESSDCGQPRSVRSLDTLVETYSLETELHPRSARGSSPDLARLVPLEKSLRILRLTLEDFMDARRIRSSERASENDSDSSIADDGPVVERPCRDLRFTPSEDSAIRSGTRAPKGSTRKWLLLRYQLENSLARYAFVGGGRPTDGSGSTEDSILEARATPDENESLADHRDIALLSKNDDDPSGRRRALAGTRLSARRRFPRIAELTGTPTHLWMDNERIDELLRKFHFVPVGSTIEETRSKEEGKVEEKVDDESRAQSRQELVHPEEERSDRMSMREIIKRIDWTGNRSRSQPERQERRSLAREEVSTPNSRMVVADQTVEDEALRALRDAFSFDERSSRAFRLGPECSEPYPLFQTVDLSMSDVFKATGWRTFDLAASPAHDQPLPAEGAFLPSPTGTDDRCSSGFSSVSNEIQRQKEVSVGLLRQLQRLLDSSWRALTAFDSKRSLYN